MLDVLSSTAGYMMAAEALNDEKVKNTNCLSCGERLRLLEKS